MKVTTRHFETMTAVAISGDVASSTAGQLSDALVAAVRYGRPDLVVDVGGIGRLTRAGMGGLVVAARLAKSRRGAMRIRGARPTVEAAIRELGVAGLVRFEPAAAPVGRSAARPTPRPARSGPANRLMDHHEAAEAGVA